MKTIRPLPKRKTCIDCKEEKPVSEFLKSAHKDSPRGFYYRSYCKKCSRARSRKYSIANRERRNRRLREWRKRNPEKARALDKRKRYQKKYGLTLEQVKRLKEHKKQRCWICEEIPKRLFIDHDHKTGEIRGCLCPSCNTFLGRIEANPTIISNIQIYLDNTDIEVKDILESRLT